MANIESLTEKVKQRFAEMLQTAEVYCGELTIEISHHHLHEVCMALRDEAEFKFEILVDVCGVDYLDYGIGQWLTEKATGSGFERGVDLSRTQRYAAPKKMRFAVVYHLLSITHNQRLRIRVFVEGNPPLIPSVNEIWNSANWYEREAFDLYGIIFDGHPDLRRILTDYGFIGNPFRKDFPLIGEVEARYDATLQRVIYEPVSIEPRTLVPKVIREAKDPIENS